MYHFTSNLSLSRLFFFTPDRTLTPWPVVVPVFPRFHSFDITSVHPRIHFTHPCIQSLLLIQ